MNDFDKSKDAIAYADLPKLDKYILGQLSATLKEVDAAYDEYNYSKVVSALMRFATSDLSNFYLDVAKDRLYISDANDFRRRSCQTVIDILLEGLKSAMAPILPHLAEDIHQHSSKVMIDGRKSSVFESLWPKELQNFEPVDNHGKKKKRRGKQY